MSTSFFAAILQEANQWQVHIPQGKDAFGDMVLRPLKPDATFPAGAGLHHARWSEKARAFNCAVDVYCLINNFNYLFKYIDNLEFNHSNNELNFLALRLFSMAEQTHPVPCAQKVMLSAFRLLWAFCSSAAEPKRSSYIHSFLGDLRMFTEENLSLRAHYSTRQPEKSPIQKGESCAIVAKNISLVLRFLNPSLTIPARVLEA